MKSCPKCGRTYDDPSLNFCLDDGEWLADSESEGESTHVLSSPQIPSEAATRQHIANTDETAILPTGATKQVPPKAVRKTKALKLIGAAAGLVLLLAAGYGVFRWYSGSDASSATIPEIEAERLTGDGKVFEAAISPDGKFLAYLEVKDAKSTLRVKQIETNSMVEILKAGEFQAINNIFFSPDGNFVYFGAVDSDRKASIYKVPTLGGSPVKIPVAAMSFSLSPDGSKIAYYGDNADTTETFISIVGSDGSDPRKIASVKGTRWVEAGTAWSPDGTQLVFVEGDDKRVGGPELSLSVYSLEDNSTKSIGSSRWERIDNRGIVWDPSGKFFYVSGATNSAKQLWRISYPEGEAVRLTRNRRDYQGLSITADGLRLVTTEEESRTGVWVSPDLDPMNAVEVFPGRGDTWGISWTPDGRVVYVSDQSGASEVWVMNADGSGQKQLTNDRLFKMEPSVSPDGKLVVYYSTVDGFQLFVVPIEGGNPERIETGQVGPSSPDFTKDGSSVVFSAWTGGKQSIYRVPLAKGNTERLTDYPSTEPRHSPDGQTLACFYLTEGSRYYSLAIIPADGGSPVKTFDIPVGTATARGPVWTPDGTKITYIVNDGEKADLWAQPIDGGDPVRLSDFKPPWIARREYSRDGKQIAISRGEGFYDAFLLKVIK